MHVPVACSDCINGNRDGHKALTASPFYPDFQLVLCYIQVAGRFKSCILSSLGHAATEFDMDLIGDLCDFVGPVSAVRPI